MESTMTGHGIQKAKVVNSLVLISVVLFIIQYLPPLWFCGLIVLGIGIAMHEFYGLLARKEAPWLSRLGIVFGIMVALSFIVGYQAAGSTQSALRIGWVELTLTLAILWVTGLGLLSRNMPDITATVAGVLLGILYVSYLGSYLIALRGLPNGENLASLVFIVTWARDAGAYGIGSMIRKGHALAPAISPHKTIEGAIAGLFFALAFALLSKLILFPRESFLHFVAIGVILGVLGQVGDLVESVFKRRAGVKDAGNLLPLHGGVLDRIDGLLFTAPALYYYVRLVMHH